MFNLSGTAHVARVVTGSAGAIDVHASWIDISQTSPAPTGISGGATTQIATATTTTVVAAPTSSTTRNISELTVSNDSSTVNNAIRVEFYDGTNVVRLWAGTLGFGERVILDASGYWTVFGTDGNPKSTGTSVGYVVAGSTVDAVTAADPSTLRYFGGAVAQRMVPVWTDPGGVARRFQERMSSSGFSSYLPVSTTTVGASIGLLWTSGGTVSHPTPAAGIYAQQKRTRWANVVTTTNQVLGLRTATTEKRYWRGNSAGQGGFQFHARFAIGLLAAASTRLFVGVNDSGTGWVVSDTLTGNGIGLWHDTTEAVSVLSLVTVNAGTAVKNSITLGSNLAAGQCYDFEMACDPNGSAIGYKLTDLLTGNVLVDSFITGSSLPLNTAFMGQELAMSNGTSNTVVTTTAFELMSHQCQSNV